MNSIRGIKLIIIILIIIVIGFSLFIWGYAFGLKAAGINGFAQGWDAARQAIEKTGLFPDNKEPLYNIAGKITDINNNIIAIEASPAVNNPLAKPAPIKRTITVGNDTIFIEQKQKSPEEFMKEQNDFFLQRLKDIKNQTESAPPLLYTEKRIKFSDLKVGDQINVVAENDIKYATQITAKEVRKNTQAISGQ
ncbi:hypothetical protein HZA71_01665 [Candidatus Falkowbacteria bacterium]|nr:hypothetical protein [Candidatus Falkowbacteria bacterium]